MRNVDSNQTPPSVETLQLHEGAGAYPIREKTIGFVNHGQRNNENDDDSVEKEMLELSQLIQAARLAVESQGGIFNGTQEHMVTRSDQEWMGSTVAISVLYVLAYKPTE